MPPIEPSGHLILCEKVRQEGVETERLFTKVHEKWKRKSFLEHEIIAKRNSLKGVMQPITLKRNLSMLRKAKFHNINVVFNWCNFVC